MGRGTEPLKTTMRVIGQQASSVIFGSRKAVTDEISWKTLMFTGTMPLILSNWFARLESQRNANFGALGIDRTNLPLASLVFFDEPEPFTRTDRRPGSGSSAFRTRAAFEVRRQPQLHRLAALSVRRRPARRGVQGRGRRAHRGAEGAAVPPAASRMDDEPGARLEGHPRAAASRCRGAGVDVAEHQQRRTRQGAARRSRVCDQQRRSGPYAERRAARRLRARRGALRRADRPQHRARGPAAAVAASGDRTARIANHRATRTAAGGTSGSRELSA